jgi:hypothetical protein
MRIAATAFATALAALVLFAGTFVPLAEARRAIEPQTSTIRIRLKGPTLRVRCRGGDCAVSLARGEGAQIAVSVTRTRHGVPFTFARTVDGPTNVAIETGSGTDTVVVGDISIPGFLRIATADGDDTLDVEGTSCAKKASVDVGGGNDTVRFAPGTIGGKFRLAAHGGDDTVAVTDGRFLEKAGFNGGPGTDALSTATLVSFAVPPVVIGFEP